MHDLGMQPGRTQRLLTPEWKELLGGQPNGMEWMINRRLLSLAGFWALLALPAVAPGQVKSQDTLYRQIKAYLDSIPAIDTHDHLRPFDRLQGYVQTERGLGMNLFGLINTSYYPRIKPLTPWKPEEQFRAWWAEVKQNFDDARATTFYRYLLPAFRDLYGVDFGQLTDEQAQDLDRRIFENYKDPQWTYDVVTRRANIELMLIDPYWAKFDFRTSYKFGVLVFNVSSLLRGFHPAEFEDPSDNPYRLAAQWHLPVNSLDDYMALLDRICREAKTAGAVGLIDDDTAYSRTLLFERVPKAAAARVFGRPQSELTAPDIKAFEDFIMWYLAELAAHYDLPFQIHTGDARLQGTNPLLLMEMIEGNPKTKFILMHGGFPWVDETGGLVMAEMSRAANVWIDSNWLPTISYTMAKRAFHEWLEVMSSNRIMWGTDLHHAEGIYAAAEMTRRCLAEVLSEKIERGDLTMEEARRIGRQIMRDNALEVFPQLKGKLWKNQSQLASP